MLTVLDQVLKDFLPRIKYMYLSMLTFFIKDLSMMLRVLTFLNEILRMLALLDQILEQC